MRLAGVVQIRETVPETRAEMQQRRRRLVGHACVSIGRARRNALEERENAMHFRDVIEGRDEVHLRRARVREAGIHSTVHEGSDQGLCAIHFGHVCSLRV